MIWSEPNPKNPDVEVLISQAGNSLVFYATLAIGGWFLYNHLKNNRDK